MQTRARSGRTRGALAVTVGMMATALSVVSGGLAHAAPHAPPGLRTGKPPPDVTRPAVKSERLDGYQIVAGAPTIAPPYVAGPPVTFASATCPAGTKVLGGGEYNNSAVGAVELRQSYASSGDDTWYAGVSNNSASHVTFYAYAVCGSGLTARKSVWGEWGTGGNSVTYAFCPAGMKVLGGGKAVTGDAERIAWWDSYGSLPDAWASSHQTISAGSSSFRPFATCGSGLKRQEFPYAHDQISPGQYKRLEVHCPEGTTVLSGGHTAYQVTDSYPIGDGTGWAIYVLNPGTTWSYNIKATAVCGS